MAAGGSAAVLTGISDQVEAEVVPSTVLPLTPPPTAGTVEWDVDGDGTNDFVLRNVLTLGASLDETNGGRFVAPATVASDGIAKLSPDFAIGDTLAPAYKFFTSAQTAITVTNGGSIAPDLNAGGWSVGEDGFFGFRFTSVSGTHYGWGRLNISGNLMGSGFTIVEAFYESVAGVSLSVSDLPGRAGPVVKVRGKKRIRTERGRVRIRGTATDTSGVAGVRYQVGRRIRAARGTLKWRFALRVKQGRTKVRVLATDSGGNVSRPARVTVIRR